MKISNQWRNRFGSLTKGTLVGAVGGFVIGVLINVAALDGDTYWLADALWMAAIGSVAGMLVGLALDIAKSLTQKR